MIHFEHILQQFDEAQADFRFPDLGHGYFYAIDCRLHAFSDRERWALVVETVVSNPRGHGVEDMIYSFGNCLTSGVPGLENDDFLVRIDQSGLVDPGHELERFNGARTISVRNEPVPVEAACGTDLEVVFRGLVPQHRELLLGTDDEVRRRVPSDLPKILQLEEWHQPGCLDNPSESEAYAQLARVLAYADADLYRPTEVPNTHWSNWPESGSL